MSDVSESRSVRQAPPGLLRKLVAQPGSGIATVALAGFVLLAMFGPWITPQNPYNLVELSILDGRLPPGAMSSESGVRFLLGTDDLGRDMLSAMIYGVRTSLIVGLVSAGLAMAIGSVVGVAAAYWGGVLDSVLMRLVDFQLSMPAILVALIVLALLGPGADRVFLALVIVQWAPYARTARGSALVEREKEYIEATRAQQLGTARMLILHLLPNCLTPIFVLGTIQVAEAIALEATLSFLGLGVSRTEPSLGMLVSNGFEYLMYGVYWISLFPAIVLMIMLISISAVAERLKDILDPMGGA